MTNLLMLWARYPFPPLSGRTKLLAQRLGFCADAGAEVHLIIFDTCSEKEQAERTAFLQVSFPFVKSVRFLAMPKLFKAAWNMLCYTILTSRKTLQEAMFFSGKYQRLIYEEIRRLQPDSIYCDTFRMAQYLEEFKEKKAQATGSKPHIVFDWDDIFSQKYQNYLERTDDDTPLLGYLSKYVPLFLQKIVNHVLRRTLLTIEISRSIRRETVLPTSADATILVSPREVETLQKRSKTSAVSALLPAVKIPNLSENVQERPESLVFMGLLNFMPNEEGLLHFLEHIYPLVKDEIPSVSLTILGANPTPRLIRAAEKIGDSVRFTGYVENPASILSSSQVFVAPVYYGTGIKTKVLDAMAYRVPVITTPQGAEGLNVRNGEEMLIAANDADFSAACVRLLRDSAKREKIRQKGLHYVLQHHTEAAVRKEFLRVCKLRSE